MFGVCRQCSLDDSDYAPIFRDLAPFRAAGGVGEAAVEDLAAQLKVGGGRVRLLWSPQAAAAAPAVVSSGRRCCACGCAWCRPGKNGAGTAPPVAIGVHHVPGVHTRAALCDEQHSGTWDLCKRKAWAWAWAWVWVWVWERGLTRWSHPLAPAWPGMLSCRKTNVK